MSNLSYISKLIKKVVAKQLNSCINNEGFSNVNQSSYRRLHFIETALLEIQNDIAASMDSGTTVALTLLDFSAAFDTIDHNILFNCLRDWFRVDIKIIFIQTLMVHLQLNGSHFSIQIWGMKFKLIVTFQKKKKQNKNRTV